MHLSMAKGRLALRGLFVWVLQSLEREIADFSKDRDKRVKAAQAKLKAAKQVSSVRQP